MILSLRKIISLCLMMALVLTMVPCSMTDAFAAEQTVQTADDAEHRTSGVPEYTCGQIFPTVLTVGNERLSDPSEYRTDFDEVVGVLRAAMVERSPSVPICYRVSEQEFDGSNERFGILVNDLIWGALVHTGVPTEGDFLRWDISGYSASGSLAYDKGYFYLDIVISLTYYTTAEQQRELDAAVDALLKEFAFSEETTDYEKVRTAYDYICSNVVYDYENLNDENYKLKFTSYAALIHKTAVCQGYATLLYRLLLESGVDCRVVTGTSHNEAHGWNIVKLDGVYYNLDSTWDAGSVQYRYFLKCENNFPDHTRSAEYDDAQFHGSYPMSETDYGFSEAVTDTWVDFAASSFSGGNGTQASPYVITSAQELALLAKYVNAENSLYSNAHYVLGCDIDLSGHDWMPIGAIVGNGLNGSVQPRGFYGHFDGAGYTISGLRIGACIPSVFQYGLFGILIGSVSNLTVSGASVNINCTDEAQNGADPWIMAGGLCALLANGGKIENCRVEQISVNVSAKINIFCGGAVGLISVGGVENVTVSGNVSAASERAVMVGGCIGSVGNDTTIRSCGFSGKVSAKSDGSTSLGNQATYLHYVGGFCGSAGRDNRNVTIKDCYAYADVYSEYKYTTQCVGGFAGALGTVFGKAVYENLIFEGSIFAKRNLTSGEEYDFWQGPRGFSAQNSATEWRYQNCVTVSGSTVTVVNRTSRSYRTETYSLEVYTFDPLFIEALGFDGALWYTDASHTFILRITGETGAPSHTLVIDAASAPTCTDGGWTQGLHCTVCGEILIEQESVDALGHSFGERESCTDEATCSVCGATEAGKQHAFDHDCDTDCNNQDCRYTRETVHQPEADDGDCTTSIACMVCGATVTEASEHAFDHSCDADCNNADCRYTRETVHQPEADDGDCTTSIACTVCGVTVTEASEHTFDHACDADCNNADCRYTRETVHQPEADDGDCSTAVCCSVCAEIVQSALAHDFSGDCPSDADGHGHACTNEGCNITEKEAHTDGDNDGLCDICGFAVGTDHAKCEANFFAKLWNAIVNLFRRLFGKPEICVCGENL